jgi:hypothetical protein
VAKGDDAIGVVKGVRVIEDLGESLDKLRVTGAADVLDQFRGAHTAGTVRLEDAQVYFLSVKIFDLRFAICDFQRHAFLIANRKSKIANS